MRAVINGNHNVSDVATVLQCSCADDRRGKLQLVVLVQKQFNAAHQHFAAATTAGS